MTDGRSAIALLTALLAASAVARAHHSFAPVYDGQRTVTVRGVVKEFRFINPHALMSIAVADATGKVVEWIVEFDGRLNLTEGGWTERSIVPGERLTVTGNPTHTDSPRMFFRKLVRPDGTEVIRHQDTRGAAIDEARRARRTPSEPK